MRISGLIATAAALAAGSTTAIGDLQAPKAVLTLRKIVDGSDANLPCWRVSPDGRQLAFVDGDHATLGIRQVATGAVRIVERAGTEESIGAMCLWSPGGRQLVYVRHSTAEQLRIVPIDGGPSRLVRQQPGNDVFEVLAWAPEGESLIGALTRGRDHTLARLWLKTGEINQLRAPGPRAITHAAVSQDGRHLAFSLTTADDINRDLLVMTPDGHEVLVSDGDAVEFPLAWSPDGQHLLFSSTRSGMASIWAVRFATGQLVGGPVLLREDVGRITPAGIANDGTLYASVYRSTSDVFVATIDDRGLGVGPPQRLVQPPGFRHNQERGQATWSPDGSRLVYTVMENGREAIAVHSLRSGGVQVFPLSLRQLERPAWFPDGRAVAIKAGNGNADLGVFRVDLADGSVRRLVERGNYFSLSPDGTHLFYTRPEGSTQLIWRRELSTGSEEVVDRGPRPAMKVSPDGRWIAIYVLDNPGRQSSAVTRTASIMVVPSSGGDRRPIATRLPNTINTITWSHDSQHVLLVTHPEPGTSGQHEVWRVALSGGEPGRVGIATGWIKHLSVSPDGRRIALSVVSGEAELWSMESLLRLR